MDEVTTSYIQLDNMKDFTCHDGFGNSFYGFNYAPNFAETTVLWPYIYTDHYPPYVAPAQITWPSTTITITNDPNIEKIQMLQKQIDLQEKMIKLLEENLRLKEEILAKNK